jgi:cytochrome d ubiquinol oxidase subunit I
MVGLGLAMIGLGAWGAWLWWRRALERSKLFLWASLLMGPSGFVAVIAGWTTAEVGRQPWVVYGVMRTARALSPISTQEVQASLIGFLVVYAVIFTAGVLYVLRLMAEGPVFVEPSPAGPRAPGTPLAAAPEDPEAPA